MGSRLETKDKARCSQYTLTGLLYFQQQNIQKKINMVEDPKGPNVINACFNQLIQQTKSLHVLKSLTLNCKAFTNDNLC